MSCKGSRCEQWDFTNDCCYLSDADDETFFEFCPDFAEKSEEFEEKSD